MVHVHGINVDSYTRCYHYHSNIDIIAIQFNCCKKFYSCILCHNALENHKVSTWKKKLWNTHAIYCGNCQNTMSINDYLFATHCVHCNHMLNAGCQNHYLYYFDM